MSVQPETRALVAQAIQLAKAGRMQEAESAFRALLESHPQTIEAHSFLAALALREDRPADAITHYTVCCGLEPGNLKYSLLLAVAKEKIGDFSGAVEIYLAAFRLNPRDTRLALYAGNALEAVGRREEAAIVFTLGDDVNGAVRTARDDPSADPGIRARAATADRVFREFFTDFHARAVDEAESLAVQRLGPAKAPDLSRVRRAIWTQTNDGPVGYRTPKQEPSIFYMPDLDPVPSVPRDQLPWADLVEAATADIRAEYLAAIESGSSMAPYIAASMTDPAWQKLRGQQDWSSFHLYAGARATPFTRIFPKTLKALERAGIMPLVCGVPVELFFSRLKAGAHIPPHFGAINSRLTVHLPLIVPEQCSIRVGNEIHTWSEGKLFAFDDSFEHEAWNRSTSDRVVLIFEAHRPDLSLEERKAIEYVFSKRENWLRARRIP